MSGPRASWRGFGYRFSRGSGRSRGSGTGSTASRCGSPDNEVWYFAFGANMHDGAFRVRRGMVPLEWRPGRIRDYRLRFNLEGRPLGRAAPANIASDPEAEVWGVLYKITGERRSGSTRPKACPAHRYRPLWLEADDVHGNRIAPAFTYIADGMPTDGKPSLR